MWIWLTPKILENQKSLFSENTGSIVVEPNACQDIDTYIDWEIALSKHRALFQTIEFIDTV
jgi:CMP-N-acetylneuraminic acid synthetase